MSDLPVRHGPDHGSAQAPLFRQIVDHLRHEIVAGNLPEHAALPSERVVAERHGVSRMTARRALEAVEAEGLAYSEERRGRFVSPQRLNYNISSMANFIADAEADGVELETRLISSNQTRAGVELARALSVPVREAVDVTTRLFLNQGHATFLETEYVVVARCRDLAHGVDAADGQLPRQRYSPLGHSADIVIRMQALHADEAELLGLAAHQPGIEQQQVIRDASGVPFCYCRQVWRGELAQFSARAIVNR
jgi:GntR family transcriptional regulator